MKKPEAGELALIRWIRRRVSNGGPRRGMLSCYRGVGDDCALLRGGKGLVALTTHGEFASRWIFHKPGEYDKVMATGFFDGLADHNLKHVASGDYYRSTFQSRDWTTKEWSRWFDVIDYVEAGINNFQDIFVMRAKD